MDTNAINDTPFHAGGRFGPGQEVYYAIHRIRLWKWYSMNTGIPFTFQDSNNVYRQKKAVLQTLCDMLGLSSDGTKNNLIAMLDRYSFTQEQIDIIGM